MLEELVTGIEYALPVFIIAVLFFILIAMIQYSKGINRNIFNFKKDMKQAEEMKKRPPIVEDDHTFLGMINKKKKLYVHNNAKHIFICGTTGSGKTVALSNFIASGIQYNYPILIVDGKGDIGNDSLLDIVHKLASHKKVYVIDLNNPDTSDKYNPFQNTSSDIIKDMLINMTKWSEEHYKYNSERYIQRLCYLLELSQITISLESLTKYMPTEQFLVLSKKLTEEKIITKEEHIENMQIAKTSGQIAENASARFSTIKESKLGQIFDETGIDIYGALKENAIILFILNPLMYPEMSPLIGKLIMIDSKKAISLFYQNKKKRIFYLLDEVNVYISKSMVDLVNKSRSANVTCILATQSLSDLDNIDNESFIEPVIENCNNYILLRQNSPTNAEMWANIIGTKRTMSATYQVSGNNGTVSPTELGSLRRTYEYIYHPNVIKELETGNAIYISRDLKYHTKVKINKPF